MVKKIIWTERAKQDRHSIFEYWTNKTKSKNFSIKLHLLFQEATKIISQYPEIGKPTSDKEVRMKIVRDFLIFYEIANDKIFILTIWDSRQNPENLKF